MKKFISRIFFTVLLCCVLIPMSFAANSSVKVTVDGKPVVFTDAFPYVDGNGRTMVPLRAVADAIGCTTSWDSATQTASVAKNVRVDGEGSTLSLDFRPDGLAENSLAAKVLPWATKNGQKFSFGLQTMDTSAITRNGRTLLPIRIVAEYFGYQVAWDSKTQTVRITSGGTYGKGVPGFSLDALISDERLTDILCNTEWVSNGYRNSDTQIYTFQPDGSMSIRTKSNAGPWRYRYSVRNNAVTIGEDSILDYCPYSNTLVSRRASHLSKQDRYENGRYVPAVYVTQVFKPYRDDVQTSLPDEPPTDFTAKNIKATMRPYLQALLYIDMPDRYCKLDYNDSLPSPAGNGYIRVTNASSIEEIAAGIRPFFTDAYFNSHFSLSSEYCLDCVYLS